MRYKQPTSNFKFFRNFPRRYERERETNLSTNQKLLNKYLWNFHLKFTEELNDWKK